VIAVRVTVLVLIFISPLALGWFGGGDAKWQRLSDIGQTHGAAAVLLSVVALVGVSLSIALQARQARQAQVFAQRDHHLQLLVIAMDRPDLLECWGHHQRIRPMLPGR
jgi:hypothetical protein